MIVKKELTQEVVQFVNSEQGMAGRNINTLAENMTYYAVLRIYAVSLKWAFVA